MNVEYASIAFSALGTIVAGLVGYAVRDVRERLVRLESKIAEQGEAIARVDERTSGRR